MLGEGDSFLISTLGVTCCFAFVVSSFFTVKVNPVTELGELLFTSIFTLSFSGRNIKKNPNRGNGEACQ